MLLLGFAISICQYLVVITTIEFSVNTFFKEHLLIQ